MHYLSYTKLIQTKEEEQFPFQMETSLSQLSELRVEPSRVSQISTEVCVTSRGHVDARNLGIHQLGNWRHL